MRIAVIGAGHVGAVLCGCLPAMNHQVVAVDINPRRIEAIGSGLPPINEPDLDTLIADANACGRLTATADFDAAIAGTEMCFVCVDTPGGPDGALDLGQVERAIGSIGDALRGVTHDYCVVMRSTVPPGTAECLCMPLLEVRSSRNCPGPKLQYFTNPEFLREGNAVRDFQQPPYILIGLSSDANAARPRSVYEGVAAPTYTMPHRTVESVKMLANVFRALKVAFANEAGSILSACGVEAESAFQLLCADDVLNISPAYLKPGFAFGGACLQKDLDGFLALAQKLGVAAPLLGRISASNNVVIDRAFRQIVGSNTRAVALFGLASKPGSNDLRGSPFVTLARRLLTAGLSLRIYDVGLLPVAAACPDSAATSSNHVDLIDRLVPTPADAVADCDLIIVAHRGAVPMDVLLPLLRDQLVIDLEGIAQLARHPGIAYRSLYHDYHGPNA